jgi:tRNA pseudouridine55 synthase
MHGILLVDKPVGVTSNDVVRAVKRCVRPSKVGHSGTLDPAASGLVVVLIGAGTRTLEYLDEYRKTYRLVIRLGEETDTCDREGTVTRTSDPSGVTTEQIEEKLQDFKGVIDQVPPHYSAIKKEGVPLYKLARKGIFPELDTRKVEIFSLSPGKWEPPFLPLDVICSKGTYARALARDLGQALGVGGRLETLRRTAGGAFKVEDSITLEDIEVGGRPVIEEHLIGLSQALSHIPDLPVTPIEVKRLMRGTAVMIPRSRLSIAAAGGETFPRLLKTSSGNGGLIILVRPEPRGAELAIQPAKVFNTWQEE